MVADIASSSKFQRVIFIVAVVLQGCSEGPSPPKVDATTSCAFVRQALSKHDKISLGAVAAYVATSLRAEDKKRDSDMIKKLSYDGFGKVIAMPLIYCQEGKAENLHQAVIETYDGIAAMQEELLGK